MVDSEYLNYNVLVFNINSCVEQLMVIAVATEDDLMGFFLFSKESIEEMKKMVQTTFFADGIDKEYTDFCEDIDRIVFTHNFPVQSHNKMQILKRPVIDLVWDVLNKVIDDKTTGTTFN